MWTRETLKALNPDELDEVVQRVARQMTTRLPTVGAPVSQVEAEAERSSVARALGTAGALCALLRESVGLPRAVADLITISTECNNFGPVLAWYLGQSDVQAINERGNEVRRSVAWGEERLHEVAQMAAELCGDLAAGVRTRVAAKEIETELGAGMTRFFDDRATMFRAGRQHEGGYLTRPFWLLP